MPDRHLTIITGGSRGIGHVLVQSCLEDGDVLNLSRQAAVEANGSARHDLYNLQGDLEDVEAVEQSLREWFLQHPAHRVKTLIHNAAVLNLGWLDDVSAADFERSFRVNVRVPLAITNTVLSCDRFFRRGARVAYVVSSLGRPEPGLSFAGMGLYSITKAALGKLALIQSREFALKAPHVEVLRIHPGIVDTDMQRELRSDSRLDPAFAEKTADLPPYEEGEWDNESPLAKPRTISNAFAAEFVLWCTKLPKIDSAEYDFYASQEFHVRRSRG